MHIARIIEYFPPHIGGMERHGLILSREQKKLGHEVDIFIGYGDEKLLPSIYKMSLQFLPLYSKLRRFCFNFWAYFAVKRQHKKNPYDIIHLHGDLIEAYLGGKLASKLNIPMFLTIHGGLNPKILKKSNLKIFNSLNHIICVSKEIKNSLLNMGVGPSKISVISSGIYLNDFNRSKRRFDYFRPIIISIGNLTVQKGFNYLIEAFSIIKKIKSSAILIIIGDGPEKLALQKKAANVNDVYFLGLLDHDKVAQLLVDSDVFVLASVTMPGYYEGTPTSLMEAMAAGLPIVATKSGGIPYLIKNNINGLLVDEKNSTAIASAMVGLLDTPNLRNKIIKQNLEEIKIKDWPLIAKKITDVYLQ